MPLALRVGQDIDDFWYGEEENLDAYIMAWYEAEEYKAWVQGRYVFTALQVALFNMWSKNTKEKYPKYESVTETSEKAEKKRVDRPKGNNDYEYLSRCL